MHLFITHFLKDLFWFTPSWADTSKRPTHLAGAEGLER